MISLILALVVLLGGYLIYGRVTERIFQPDDRATPAVAINDGDTVSVDFNTGVITDETTGESFQGEPFPEFIQNIIQIWLNFIMKVGHGQMHSHQEMHVQLVIMK